MSMLAPWAEHLAQTLLDAALPRRCATLGANARFCRDEGRSDHDRLLGHVRRVVDPSNGVKPGWQGAWMQRTPPR